MDPLLVFNQRAFSEHYRFLPIDLQTADFGENYHQSEWSNDMDLKEITILSKTPEIKISPLNKYIKEVVIHDSYDHNTMFPIITLCQKNKINLVILPKDKFRQLSQAPATWEKYNRKDYKEILAHASRPAPQDTQRKPSPASSLKVGWGDDNAEYTVKDPNSIVGPVTITASWFRPAKRVQTIAFVYDNKVWVQVPEDELNQPYAKDPKFTWSDEDGNKYTWDHLKNGNSMQQQIFREYVSKYPPEAQELLTLKQ